MNNTWDHYQDNHVEWLLDDPDGMFAYLMGETDLPSPVLPSTRPMM